MKIIVVGLDGSERAPGVLAAGIELARKLGGRLALVRGVSLPVEMPIEAMTVAPNGLPAMLLERAEQSLAVQTQDVPRELIERVEARLGSPWQSICELAKELNADLIVVGTHGYDAVDRLLGTTAARVVNHAPCSVFVVR